MKKVMLFKKLDDHKRTSNILNDLEVRVAKFSLEKPNLTALKRQKLQSIVTKITDIKAVLREIALDELVDEDWDEDKQKEIQKLY